MAYAHITEFDFDDDRNTRELRRARRSPFRPRIFRGAIHHSAGFDDAGVFRMYEVWASREHRARFVKETLQPLLAEGPADATHPLRPDREYGYELHTSFQ